MNMSSGKSIIFDELATYKDLINLQLKNSCFFAQTILTL